MNASAHPMAPKVDADERGRLDFAVSLNQYLRGPVTEALKTCFETSAAPAFSARHGRPPAEWREARAAMAEVWLYKGWSALSRAQQEYYVDVTATTCDRQLPDLIDRFRTIASDPSSSTLVLDPSVVPPRYVTAVDIHCVPGGTTLERGADDVYAGARSDLGAEVFAAGRHGASVHDKGLVGVAALKERYPDLAPRRILDLGCTVANSTFAYVDAFPAAEVHAIDVGAACLRYAHARAEALGKAIHFRQADAEHTPYPDESFDLVVSHILLHETSAKALKAIVAECHRLLAPGGVMLHIEVPVRRNDVFEQFLVNWDSDYNAEPFWRTLSEVDLVAPALAAGFPREAIHEWTLTTGSRKPGGWLGYAARKPR
jgi:SAM-dependent methyltransferase